MAKKSKVEDFNYGSGKARGFLCCLIARFLKSQVNSNIELSFSSAL